MSITVSGFNYPGDKVYFVNKLKIFSILIPVVIVDTFLFIFLDLYHLNIASFLFYTGIGGDLSTDSVMYAFFMVLNTIARPIFKLIIAYYFLGEERSSKKVTYHLLFSKAKYYIFLSLTIELLGGMLLLFLFASLSMFLLLPLFILLAWSMYIAVAVILAIITIAIIIILINIPLTPIQMISISVIYSLIASIYFWISMFNNFKPKDRNLLISKNKKEVGYQQKLISKSHSKYIIEGQYIICSKGKKIYIYSNEQQKYPIYVLKGHSRDINYIFTANNYLMSISSDGANVGLWEINNSFLFKRTHLLVSDEDPYYQNIQVSGRSIYFNVQNVIYSKYIGPGEQTDQILEFEGGFLTNFCLLDSLLCCVLDNENSTGKIIQIWNIDNKEKLAELIEPQMIGSSFDFIHIIQSTLILQNRQKIYLYRLGSKIEKIDIPNQPEIINQIACNQQFIVLMTLKNGKRKKDPKKSMLQIYSSSSSFDLLNEFETKSIFRISLTEDNFLLIDEKLKKIYRYSLNQLVSL